MLTLLKSIIRVFCYIQPISPPLTSLAWFFNLRFPVLPPPHSLILPLCFCSVSSDRLCFPSKLCLLTCKPYVCSSFYFFSLPQTLLLTNSYSTFMSPQRCHFSLDHHHLHPHLTPIRICRLPMYSKVHVTLHKRTNTSKGLFWECHAFQYAHHMGNTR